MIFLKFHQNIAQKKKPLSVYTFDCELTKRSSSLRTDA